MSIDTKSVAIPVDFAANGTFNIWKAPDDNAGGGVTIKEAFLVGAGTFTSGLFTASDAGTPAVNGTVVASGAGTIAVGVPKELTVADGWVDGGEWLQYQHTAGTLLAGSYLVVNYVDGR